MPRRLTEIPSFAAAVPEPGSLALLGVGLAAALAFLRRQPRCRRPSEVMRQHRTAANRPRNQPLLASRQ